MNLKYDRMEKMAMMVQSSKVECCYCCYFPWLEFLESVVSKKKGELLLSLEEDGVFGVGGKLEDDGERDIVRDVGGDEYSDMLLWR